MIHFALAIIAIFIVLLAGRWALGFVANSFEGGTGCGCLSIVMVVVLALVALIISC